MHYPVMYTLGRPEFSTIKLSFSHAFLQTLFVHATGFVGVESAPEEGIFILGVHPGPVEQYVACTLGFVNPPALPEAHTSTVIVNVCPVVIPGSVVGEYKVQESIVHASKT